MFYSLSSFLKTQPYYNRYVNMIRSGTWSMIVFTSIVDIFSYLFGHNKGFFGIILMAICVLSFFGGIVLCWYRYNKHIEGIYQRFKQKRIDDTVRNKLLNGDSSESNSSRDEDTDDNSMSNDSYDSNNKEKQMKKNKKSNKNELNNSEIDEDDDEYDESNSDKSSVQLNDRISERITAFGAIGDICNYIFL